MCAAGCLAVINLTRHVIACDIGAMLLRNAAPAPPATSVEFARYTAGMSPPAAGEALVVEDKDTSSLWRQNADAYACRLESLLQEDQKTLARNPASAGKLRWRAHAPRTNWASKHCSIPRFSRNTWFSAGLPYLFGSVKTVTV